MDRVIAEYIGKKILDDIRSGTQIQPEIYKKIVTTSVVDHMRENISQQDMIIITALCESKDETSQHLGLALISKFKDYPNVRILLEKLWGSPNLYFYSRQALQARLLDYPDLDTEIHQKLLLFTLENWDKWISEIVMWAGGPEVVLNYCEERLNNKKTPTSKRWLYVCCAASSSDAIGRRDLIESYSDDADPFMQKVVTEVRKRIS